VLKTTNASAGELTDSQTEQIHLLRESRIHCEFQELLSRWGVQTVFKSSHENMFELHRPLDPESTWNDVCSQKHICRTDPQRNTVNPGSTFSSCFSREWLIIVQSGCDMLLCFDTLRCEVFVGKLPVLGIGSCSLHKIPFYLQIQR
jgi:hypothetical protein